MQIRETFVERVDDGDEKKAVIYGEGNWYDVDDNDLYRRLQREYGRCESKIYVDTARGARECGWVFVKRVPYDDAPGTYLREVWVHTRADDYLGAYDEAVA